MLERLFRLSAAGTRPILIDIRPAGEVDDQPVERPHPKDGET